MLCNCGGITSERQSTVDGELHYREQCPRCGRVEFKEKQIQVFCTCTFINIHSAWCCIFKDIHIQGSPYIPLESTS